MVVGPNAFAVVELILLIGILCYRPTAGLLAVLAVTIALPGFFSQFGIALSPGARYLPNTFVALSFATVWIAIRKRKVIRYSLLDTSLLLYVALATAITFVTQGSEFNPGVWIKQFAIWPLFYFVGRLVGTSRNKGYRPTARALYVFMWVLATYQVVFVAMETRGYLPAAEFYALFARVVKTEVLPDFFLKLDAHRAQDFYRVLGPQLESTHAAFASLVCLVSLAGVRTGKGKKWEIARHSLVALLAITMFLTGSRAALIGLLTSVAVLMWLRRTPLRAVRQFQIVAAVYLSGVLIAGMVATGAIADIAESLKRTTFYSDRLSDESSVEGRLEAYSLGWKKVEGTIWFGSGIGGEVGEFIDSPTTTHSYYLDVVAWQGLLMGTWYFGLCGAFLFRSWAVARRVVGLELAATARVHAALAVGAATVYLANPEKPQLAAVLWLGAGLVQGFGQPTRSD